MQSIEEIASAMAIINSQLLLKQQFTRATSRREKAYKKAFMKTSNRASNVFLRRAAAIKIARPGATYFFYGRWKMRHVGLFLNELVGVRTR